MLLVHQFQILLSYVLRPSIFELQAILRRMYQNDNQNDIDHYKAKGALYMFVSLHDQLFSTIFNYFTGYVKKSAPNEVEHQAHYISC